MHVLQVQTATLSSDQQMGCGAKRMRQDTLRAPFQTEPEIMQTETCTHTHVSWVSMCVCVCVCCNISYDVCNGIFSTKKNDADSTI